MSRVASEPGTYTNFTGRISYKFIECKVKNSTFELYETNKLFKNKIDIWVLFEKGTVVSGILFYANISECNFYGSTISHSVFHSGSFQGRSFSGSIWYDGNWISGDWNRSYDKFGRLRAFPPTEWNKVNNRGGVANKPGIYCNFNGLVEWKKSKFNVEGAEFEIPFKEEEYIIFHDGTIVGGTAEKVKVFNCNFKKGTFKNGLWNDGDWEDGNFIYSEWAKGTWKNGEFEKSNWYKGTWENGDWWSGTWFDGTWLGGRWDNGTWYGGYDNGGTYHSKYNSPDKWN